MTNTNTDTNANINTNKVRELASSYAPIRPLPREQIDVVNSHDSTLKVAETELECQGVSVVRERPTVEKSQIDQIDVVNDF